MQFVINLKISGGTTPSPIVPPSTRMSTNISAGNASVPEDVPVENSPDKTASLGEMTSGQSNMAVDEHAQNFN